MKVRCYTEGSGEQEARGAVLGGVADPSPHPPQPVVEPSPRVGSLPSSHSFPSPDDFRIFCGDLGNEVNDDILARAFSRYPSFLKAKVIRDKRTGKTKGYGFVSFKDPNDYVRAMREMNGEDGDRWPGGGGPSCLALGTIVGGSYQQTRLIQLCPWAPALQPTLSPAPMALLLGCLNPGSDSAPLRRTGAMYPH
uniref:RNA-binding protein 42 n=1 Tax=Pelusios castaneus TaxID=367368 RepID=A0A8C8VJ51_9SAUR